MHGKKGNSANSAELPSIIARRSLSQPNSSTLVTTPTHTLSAITESVSVPLEDVESVGIGRELTLATNGDEICLTRLIVMLNFEGVQLPELWFEKDEMGRNYSVVDVEDELRGWFGAVGVEMAKCVYHKICD